MPLDEKFVKVISKQNCKTCTLEILYEVAVYTLIEIHNNIKCMIANGKKSVIVLTKPSQCNAL